MNSSSHSGSHTGRPANRLVNETSPYLLQHAYNPVDWFPWGDEAFEKARREEKPIFLSIGYSACHWCHVMERESFENEGIAKFLNEHFVSIKVDREERPDLDQIYMSAVQLITKRGGWPMSVFLTADGSPFFGGTYWPPASRHGMPGFPDILMKLQNYWATRREEVLSSAKELVQVISEMAVPVFDDVPLDAETLRNAMQQYLATADRRNGGFGGAPKFPHPMDLRVLLRCWKRFGEESALDFALFTFRKMANGGIYDHLGGGFHRYSTDAYWLAPHFEKMLYDNALLVPAYLEGYQITKDAEFERVVRETLDYVLLEMTSPEGGFYSTQDADSEGEEGKFFVWSEQEIRHALGERDAALFNDCYDVSPRGNWEGKNILNRPKPWGEVAVMHGISDSDLHLRIDECRQKLLALRNERVHPGRDDKILTGWNGMMITAFAQASLVLNEPRYRDAAVKASDFVLNNLFDFEGRLLHCYQNGRARFAGYLDDAACLIDGLVETAQVSGRWDFVAAAERVADDTLKRFSDPHEAGLFYTADDHEQLITRMKDSQDNATPSGNGMMATALLKLSRLTSRDDLEDAATSILKFLSGLLTDHPRAAGQSLIALDSVLGPFPEIVIAKTKSDEAEPFTSLIAETFLPNRVLVVQSPEQPSGLSIAEDKTASETSTFYLCERGACQSPVTTKNAASQLL